jgi:murein DD-endopeptidase MepM/ murein hydrolase activator NlpD
VKIHDGEMDQKVRRSLFAGIPYMLTQRQRIKNGLEKITGNYIIIQPDNARFLICIVHLKKQSFVVNEGDKVVEGEKLAECGNSGNSTQPHIHIQAMDSLDLYMTKGIPLYFERFYESNIKKNQIQLRKKAFPNKGTVITSNDYL